MSPADPDRSRTFPRPPRPQPPSELVTGPTRMHPSDEPTISQSGSRFPMRPRGPGGGPPPGPEFPPIPAPRFVSNGHGYDRVQVDQYVADLMARLGAAEERRMDAIRRLSAERQRAEQVEKELRGARVALQNGATAEHPTQVADTHIGFGYRAERILRVAEAEAQDVRNTAAAEAGALLERAHADAEAHRHEVEKSLIARIAVLEEEATRRTAELTAREQQLARDIEAARQEAERMRAAAHRDAEAMRHEADEAIAAARAAAEAASNRQRSDANAEIDRLNGVQVGLRDDFARLHRLITAELPPEQAPPTEQ